MDGRKFNISDDVRIIETGERAKITDLLHNNRYGVYVAAEDSDDGTSYCDELNEEELSW